MDESCNWEAVLPTQLAVSVGTLVRTSELAASVPKKVPRMDSTKGWQMDGVEDGCTEGDATVLVDG